MSDEEQKAIAKEQAKQQKKEDTAATQKALETGAQAAAAYFGGPKAGKAASIGRHLPSSKLVFRQAANRVNKVPGSVEASHLVNDSGVLDAVDRVSSSGKMPTKGSGAGFKDVAGAVLSNKKKDGNDLASKADLISNVENALNKAEERAQRRSGAEKDKGDKNSLFSGFFGGGKKGKFSPKKKKIIIAVAAVAAVLAPIVIIVTIIGGITGSYGSEAVHRTAQGEDAADVLQDYYAAFCKNGEDCTAEQEAILESHSLFFERLNEIGNKYNLTEKQKFIIYKTIIYDYDVGGLLSGQAFNIDKELDENSEEKENPYESGKDTIGFLAEKLSNSEEYYYLYLLNNDYFEGKINYISDYKSYANIKQLDVNSISSWSKEDREAVRITIVNNIKDTVNTHYPEKKVTYISTYTINNTLWWWPIAGATVENVSTGHRANKFSYDSPLYTRISSYFGYRTDPVTGVKNKYHSGIDIPAALNTPVIAARAGTVTAITNECRTKSSTESDRACGGTYGNHIKIKTDDGYEYIYGHLALDTITVSVNDRVEQGQVVANVGSSGKSTGYHLHVSIKTPNGNYVNPLDYFDPSNPRPVDEFADLFRFIEYNENGTSLSNAVECGLDGAATSRYGMLIKYRVLDYANHGYTLVDVPVYRMKDGELKLRDPYSNYCRDIESDDPEKNNAFDAKGNPSTYESLIKVQYFDREIPLEITQAVYRDLMASWTSYIKKKAAKYEIELNKQQVDALVSLAWSGYEAVNRFFGEDKHGEKIKGEVPMIKKYGYTEDLCKKWWNSWYTGSAAAEAEGNHIKTDENGERPRRQRECKLFVYGDYSKELWRK